MSSAQELADRYVAVWNETGADARRRIIRELWVPDGLHFVGVREARGYDELEQRIIGSHEKNISAAGNSFRAVTNARTLRNGVTFNWEMISPKGDVLATGLEFLIVDDRQRILVDYQFIVN
jgi:hypothetical protein